MTTTLVPFPKEQPWIPYSTAVPPEKYKVLQIEVIYPVTGKLPMLLMRLIPLEKKPAKWLWRKRRECMEVFVYDSPDARRSLKKTILLKRYGTTDDSFHVIHRIVD